MSLKCEIFYYLTDLTAICLRKNLDISMHEYFQPSTGFLGYICFLLNRYKNNFDSLHLFNTAKSISKENERSAFIWISTKLVLRICRNF